MTNGAARYSCSFSWAGLQHFCYDLSQKVKMIIPVTTIIMITIITITIITITIIILITMIIRLGRAIAFPMLDVVNMIGE